MSYHSRTLVIASQAPVVGAIMSIGNDRMIVEGLGKKFRLDDEAPSLFGSSFLGYEGSWARYAYLRPAPNKPVALAVVEKTRGEFSYVCPAPSESLLRPMQLILRDYLGAPDLKAKRPVPTLIELASYKRYSDRSGRMSLAWVVAKRVSTLLGGAPRHYLGAALRAIAAFHRAAGQPVDAVVEAVRAAWHRG